MNKAYDPCLMCLGTGDCTGCGGNGRFMEYVCAVCAGTGVCSECNGSGVESNGDEDV